jgi:SagB-type dehydrogenase family enzyme
MKYKLPAPSYQGKISLEETLYTRHSVREFKPEPLSLKEVSQLLWATGGQNKFARTFPSAGATYPSGIYLVNGQIENLAPGVYLYQSEEHALILRLQGDVRKALSRSALGQEAILQAPISIVLSVVYERTTSYYGQRGIRYTHIEIGHMGENLHLEVEALGLGCVMIGAFSDEGIQKVLKLPSQEMPLYIIPVGRKKTE